MRPKFVAIIAIAGLHQCACEAEALDPVADPSLDETQTSGHGEPQTSGLDEPPPLQPVPEGRWTPTPWQAHPADPTCVHVDVEADCKDGWCRIPAGCYVHGMASDAFGSDAYSGQSAVRLTRNYEIMQTEMTWKQWEELGLERLAREGLEECPEESCPVGFVGWYRALAVANALSEQKGLTGCYELKGCSENVDLYFTCEEFSLTSETHADCDGYRLPSEFEWEYAARAGVQTPLHNGEFEASTTAGGNGAAVHDCLFDKNVNALAFYCKNSRSKSDEILSARAQPVQGRTPNRWGLYDVLGNTSEWVFTARDPTRNGKSIFDPEDDEALSTVEVRHCRGGSALSSPAYVQLSATIPSFITATVPSFDAGLRFVRTLPE